MGEDIKGIRAQVRLNADQQAAFALAKSDAHKHHLFYGPAGSGKSFFIQWLVFSRAIVAPGSRHAVFRLTLSSCRDTLFDKTAIEVLDAVWPGLRARCKISLSEHTITLPNGPDKSRPHDGGSVVFYDGLDENRLTKVLGNEFNTIWLNECNEFTYSHVSTLLGRLRYVAHRADGSRLTNKMFYDCNPRWKADWEYQAFKRGVIPGENEPMPRAEQWVSQKLNTTANLDNLVEDYMDTLAAGSRQARMRYLVGEWADENTNGLFFQDDFDRFRITKDLTHTGADMTPGETIAWLGDTQDIQLERVTVACDPATTSKQSSDLSGITVQGIDRDGVVYVLADETVRATPDEVSRRVVEAFTAWGAARVVLEKNAGGEWLESTLRKHHERLPISFVAATSTTGGKRSRAEPVSAEYERGRVRHVGTLPALESQMCEFGSPHFRGSPDRMDAVVWGVTELMNLHGERQRTAGYTPIRTVRLR